MKRYWVGVTLACGVLLYGGGDVEKVEQVEPAVDIQEVKALEETLVESPSLQRYPFYVGIGAGGGEAKSYYYSRTFAALSLKAGYHITDWLALEARAMKGVVNENDLYPDYSIGLYLKPQYRYSEHTTLYALLGYAQTKIVFDNEYKINGILNNVTRTRDFSYGAGIAYRIEGGWNFDVEVIKHNDKEIVIEGDPYANNVTGVYIGFMRDFLSN